ncbi:MAG: ABC transporter permease [Porphyromonas sp.]|nr:ABC transporter permease [Porphyromonas sp.]
MFSLLRKKIEEIGLYFVLMKRVFERPDRFRMFLREMQKEVYKLGYDSLGIVLIISFFIGAVITIQLGLNLTSPLIPKFTIGFTTREIVLLEFSSTVMCLILAGKIGSSIASEIGTMRVSEQIDAIEIMGVNSANFLILPKIVGIMLFVPVLVLISMFTGIIGGYIACSINPEMPISAYVQGIQYLFEPYYLFYSMVKSEVYVFLIASIAAFNGYYVKGGALEVGKASTKAVVSSSIMILVADLLLTQLMLV